MAELAREMILEDCIARLQAGETVTSCLARYGDQAAELAPLLATAARLQGVGPRRLTNGQHLRTKMALREALAARRARAAGTALGWRGWWGQARGLAVAGLLILGLCVTAGVTSVAASRPGDVAYPVRVTLERAPAWLQFSPAGRAAAELQVAERRLADVTGYLQATGQVAPAAVDALLAGDQAATANAAALPEREREAITRRVAIHAETLTALARTAGPGAAELALDEAAAQAAALAERLSPGSMPTPTAPAPPTLPPATDVPAADSTPTPAAVPQPEHRDDTPTPLPTPTVRTVVPGQRATVLAQTATVAAPTTSPEPAATPTIVTQTITPTPAAGGPVNTPVPGRRATALAATATGQPPTATPSSEPPPTDRPSGATGTPAPGRRATALAQTATAQAAPITPTPGGQ